MYVRLTRTMGSTDRAEQDAAIVRWRDLAVPALKAQIGYLGSYLGVQRAAGKAAAVSYWLDRESLEASAANAAAIRARVGEVDSAARVTELETYEIAFLERLRVPSSGIFTRTNDATAAPGRIDDLLAFFTDRVAPVLRGQPGFYSTLVGVNRENGRVIVASNWETEEDLARSEAAVVDLREEAARVMGSQAPVVEKWEVAYLELLQGVEQRP